MFVEFYYKRCRLCAYVMDNLIAIETEFVKRIILLFQLKIGTEDDDHFPRNICLNCFNSVNSAWSFFEMITKAQREFFDLSTRTAVSSYSEWSQKRSSELKNEKLGNTIIFNEVSVIPINTTGSIRNISEGLSAHFSVASDINDPLKCSILDAVNSTNLKAHSPEEPLRGVQEALLACNDNSNLSLNSGKSSESSKHTESIPVEILTRKRTLRKLSSKKCTNIKSVKCKQKDSKLHITRSRGKGYITTPKRPKTKIIKRLQIRSKKKSTEDYQLDPKDIWPDYPWICNVCHDKCSDIDDYKKHSCFQLHKRFFCADCPKTLVRPEQFFQHISEVHWERINKHTLLQCDECLLWCPTVEAQEDHRKNEHPKALPRPPLPESPPKHPYQCDQCDKDCKTRSQLTNHLKMHSKDKPHVCDVCGKAYFYPSSLLEHKRLHNKSRDFICEQCGRGFYNKGTLKSHKQTHLAIDDRELPWVCSYCKKRFANRCKLRYHEMVHTGAKPFICDICGRNFRLRDSLKGHVNIVHSEEKLHSCSCCDMKFKTSTNLSAHMRQHTGEHPYACTECSKTFSNYSNCDKHMKRIHNLTLKGRVNLAKICATLRKETEEF